MYDTEGTMSNKIPSHIVAILYVYASAYTRLAYITEIKNYHSPKTRTVEESGGGRIRQQIMDSKGCNEPRVILDMFHGNASTLNVIYISLKLRISS